METNKYLLKAIDAYPYNLEESLECLEYALSYNAEDVTALCLMGRLYSEQFQDYDTAIQYFQEALSININALNVHQHYINVLLWNDDYEQAQKFIDFAFSVKGVDKASLHLKQAYLHEYQFKYKEALKAITKAKTFTMNNSFMTTLDEEEKRIENKIAKLKNGKNGNKKKQE